MKCNVGETDRKIRIAIGIVALYLGLTISPWFLVVATGILLSAIVKLCPLYNLLGINTCKHDDKHLKADKEKPKDNDDAEE